MRIEIHDDAAALGRAAAEEGAAAIRVALAARGRAAVVFATGASQFAMLDHLVGLDLDWSRVEAFHLDEYVGLPADHPASFRRYLRERVLDRLPPLAGFTPVEGDAADLPAALAALNARISDVVVDVCFAGIGENCHLAFNDPPADFAAEAPYIVVDLDEACRRQQLGEGWFATLDAVPRRAVTMSIGRILAARRIVAAVPDARKAAAVRAAVEGPVTPAAPASVLQRHPAATLHLDRDSASLLGG